MSQQKAVLEYLEQGNLITPLIALQRFNSFRLGSIIYRLRREGYNIKTEPVTEGNKTYARYRLQGREDLFG